MKKIELRKAIKEQLNETILLNGIGKCKIENVEKSRENILYYLCENFNIKNLHFIKVEAVAEKYEGLKNSITIKYYINVYSNIYNVVGNMECIIYDFRKQNEWKEV